MSRLGERGKARRQAEALGLRWNVRRTHNWEVLRVALDVYESRGAALVEYPFRLWPSGIHLLGSNLTDYKRLCKQCNGTGIVVFHRRRGLHVVDADCVRCGGKGGGARRRRRVPGEIVFATAEGGTIRHGDLVSMLTDGTVGRVRDNDEPR